MNKRSVIEFLSFLKVINIKKSSTLRTTTWLLFGTQITFNLQFFRRRTFDRSHLLSSNSSYFQRACRIKFVHIFSHLWLLVLSSIWRKPLFFTTNIFLRPHEILKVLTLIRTYHHRLFFGLNRLKTGCIQNNFFANRTWNWFNYNTCYHIYNTIWFQTLMHWSVLNQQFSFQSGILVEVSILSGAEEVAFVYL